MTNNAGRGIIGTDPDCTCDGVEITVYDCWCEECQSVAGYIAKEVDVEEVGE